jgi:hypothetical protein
MGMPLVIASDIDVDLKIVEDPALNTAGCFTYCDADGNPVGYTTSLARDLRPCADANAFEIDACVVDVAVDFISGAGDEANAATLEGLGSAAVGLWDPAGVNLNEHLNRDADSL